MHDVLPTFRNRNATGTFDPVSHTVLFSGLLYQRLAFLPLLVSLPLLGSCARLFCARHPPGLRPPTHGYGGTDFITVTTRISGSVSAKATGEIRPVVCATLKPKLLKYKGRRELQGPAHPTWLAGFSPCSPPSLVPLWSLATWIGDRTRVVRFL